MFVQYRWILTQGNYTEFLSVDCQINHEMPVLNQSKCSYKRLFPVLQEVNVDTSRGAVVSNPDQHTIVSDFNSHWLLYTSDLMLN